MSKTTFKPFAVTTLNQQIKGFTLRTVRGGKVSKVKRDNLAAVLFVQSVYQIAGASKSDATKANGNTSPMLALADKFKTETVLGTVFAEWLATNAPFISLSDDDGVTLDKDWVKQALALDFDQFDTQSIVDMIEAEKKTRKAIKDAEEVDTIEVLTSFVERETKRLANHTNAATIKAISDLLKTLENEAEAAKPKASEASSVKSIAA